MGQTSSIPSELIDRIIFSLRTENFDSFKSLLLDTTDFKEMYGRYGNKFQVLHSKSYLELEKELFDSSSGIYKKLFERLLADGKNFDIDWGQIKNKKLVAADPNGFTNPNLRQKIANLYFSYKDTFYVVFYILVLNLSSGYKVGTIGFIRKLGIVTDAQLKQLESLKLF